MPVGHYDRIGKPHPHKGHVQSEEAKQKCRETKLGENNPLWKGNDVGYHAVHDWIKTRLQKSDLCPICKERPPYDLANITGIYNRDLSNWQWQCRRCHMHVDGRINNLKQFASM